MTPPDLDALVRDIEMTYEMLFAFVEAHGPSGDDEGDPEAAWGEARELVRDAITRALPRRSAD